jgi:transcription elongation factor GreA-like protein
LGITSPKAARAGRIDNIGRTDANGIINVPIKATGPIRLHTIKMERLPGFTNEADWVSFWATLTLDIR